VGSPFAFPLFGEGYIHIIVPLGCAFTYMYQDPWLWLRFALGIRKFAVFSETWRAKSWLSHSWLSSGTQTLVHTNTPLHVYLVINTCILNRVARSPLRELSKPPLFERVLFYYLCLQVNPCQYYSSSIYGRC
jgi:hypothetical protein